VNVCGDGILEMLEHSTIFCLDVATNGFILGWRQTKWKVEQTSRIWGFKVVFKFVKTIE
jgi:hypothetical protein